MDEMGPKPKRPRSNPEIPMKPQRPRRSCSERKTSTDDCSAKGLRVTPFQLRELWLHDGVCGRRYMKGCPQRTCSALDDLIASFGDEQGMDRDMMDFWKSRIESMWRKAGTLFEIFINEKEKNLGYRLRVKSDASVKLCIKPQDAIEFGWVAQIPAEMYLAPGAHVFNRSAVDPDPIIRGGQPKYIGGPISFLNWCPAEKMKVTVTAGSNHSICRMSLNGLFPRGMELMWDYGLKTAMPNIHEWFFPLCCQEATGPLAEKKRHEQHINYRDCWFREACVLCGQEYSMGNKYNRVQRKQHLVGSHADYLGSVWDGCGSYESQEVDLEKVLFIAEKLNQLLSTLKSMNWNVTPACNVFSKEELKTYGHSCEAIVSEFNRRKEMVKKMGVLVLRGFDVPSSSDHFIPIKPQQWKLLPWKNNIKPLPGRYGVPDRVREEVEALIPSIVTKLTVGNK
ncbi:UPF0210 protein PAE3581 [Frankliniella fusca]|uniref:UPF0210 protein PAE3581 n=1 Tax=Frankliniella fusca TaxID=407009 RepID=A0AAE1LQC3_9NEOP|nr:UPF0210 protein PAE3581 [Frankliniella fusca]